MIAAKQRFGLGIDTGGTYTDACIYDFATQEVVASAKARTTYDDLAIGINAAVTALGNAHFPAIEMVSLSTTLATNAMVEGRGGRECLLLLGYEREVMERLASSVGLELHKHVYFIAGKFDSYGQELIPLDLAAARKAISAVQHDVDAIGISGYLSVVNSAHELAVKELAQQICDLPVTCGHELTGELQSVKRAATVALNARLIPIIRELISSVEAALRNQGIKAPLAVVQGDGSLVRAEVAMQQPVQTILSGPAASSTGGAWLSGRSNCIVVDTGGTSTDIAVLKGGIPELDPNGASVGKWRTSIAAVKVRTIGLGGDSHIKLTRTLDIEVGPERVIPLCVAAAEYPAIQVEIERLAAGEPGSLLVQPFDFLCLVRPHLVAGLRGFEAQVAQALVEHPLSLPQAAERLGVSHPLLLDTRHLESLGVIGRAGLTPTDLQHASGRYVAWNAYAARVAIGAVAAQREQTPAEFIAQTEELISRKLALEILAKLVGMGEKEPVELPGCASCKPLVELGLGMIEPQAKGGLNCRFTLDYPLVALGAPGDAYLHRAAQMLGAEVVVPPYTAVANAVGAITGNVIRVATCAVVPMYNISGISGYSLTGVANGEIYTELAAALAAAQAAATTEATRRAAEAGASEVSLRLEQVTVGEKVHLETRIVATAVGKPTLRR